ncbi:MAG TPA: P-II family nitrogen regulator [Lachnospiraceae bacterium]|nr:P-II family nitrogen regulator [Lachnospiraceae bacterium]HEX3076151.1 P-II family nitrogen regulator [Lachnospiraceae bacterium]
MKEVMAIVRLNKVNQTKEALAEAGFPAFTCRKVLGRGKKSVDLSVLESVLQTGELPISPVGENLTESSRLIPKRVFTLMVKDDEVNRVVDVIIETNHTGNKGDGKIFILPVTESYNVRNGELSADSY